MLDLYIMGLEINMKLNLFCIRLGVNSVNCRAFGRVLVVPDDDLRMGSRTRDVRSFFTLNIVFMAGM